MTAVSMNVQEKGQDPAPNQKQGSCSSSCVYLPALRRMHQCITPSKYAGVRKLFTEFGPDLVEASGDWPQ